MARMHGLINKSLQWFLSDSFGAGLWHEIARQSGVAQSLGPDGFETMQLYDDALTDAVLDAAVRVLRRPHDSLLEDFGTYLVSKQRMEPLRRLLRFGGVSFTDFLYSLDDLRGRSQLALPELALPDLNIDEAGEGRFTLTCSGGAQGFGHVMVGILRALADDYGALAVLEHHGATVETAEERIRIEVHDPAFHAGRRFDLAVEQSG